MSSKAGCSMNDELYRHSVRHHFMGRVENPQLQQKIRQAYMTEPSQQKEQSFKPHQKIYEATLQAKQRFCSLTPTSGGDADRMLYHSAHPSHQGDSCRIRNNYDNFSLKQLQTVSKSSALPSNTNTSSRKYQTPAAEDFIGDHSYLYENDSNLGGIENGSQEDSAKSQKSSKTVVSRKSSQELRKLVTSQCKLHEVIGETLKEMCSTEAENTVENNACGFQGESSAQYPLTLSQCKRCSDRIHTVQPQKDVTTEIGKGDFLDCRNPSPLTISVDDVINSRVINPMIHKLHRMYLNNLKEEMSLMEDLERLPTKVNEVYKSIIFKQKD